MSRGQRVTRGVALAAAVALLAGCSGGSTTGAPDGSERAAGTASAAPVSGVHPAAQAYVDAVNSGDLSALVGAFAPDGEVIDVSRTISGRDAIREWAQREVIGGRLRVIEVAERRSDGQRLLVQWAPSGSAGWRAFYDFTVTGDLIRTANLQYA